MPALHHTAIGPVRAVSNTTHRHAIVSLRQRRSCEYKVQGESMDAQRSETHGMSRDRLGRVERFIDDAYIATGKLPGPADNFRWRYHGLFNVAPAQESFMLRMRIPNGILKAHQLAGCADLFASAMAAATCM